MGDFLPRTPMNLRAKFDAANFFLAGEIRNRTNKKQNKKLTVNDISTFCLSACVDKKLKFNLRIKSLYCVRSRRH